jgi:hypothetical protein
MASMITVNCQRCKQPFEARVADRKRGWAKFCSKSCKAIRQTQRTGNAGPNDRNYRGSGVDRETYQHYANEYGGVPQFSRSGNYEGMVMSQGDLAAGGYGDADRDTPFGDGKW